MKRRLQALRVGNFKAFAATQRIPLKPITLVFGPNSAGKSSFIHSLALAHEAQFGREKRGRSRLDVHHTDIGGTTIDLGGFRQYIFRGQLNRRVEWGAELNVSELDPERHKRLRELIGDAGHVTLIVTIGTQLDDQDKPVPGAEPSVVAFELQCDGIELIRLSRRYASTPNVSEGSLMRIDRVNTTHPVIRAIIRAVVDAETTTELRTEDLAIVETAISDLLPDLSVRVERLFPTSIELSAWKSTIKKLAPKAAAIGLGMLAGPLGAAAGLAASTLLPVSKGGREEQLAQTVRLFFPGTLNDLIVGICGAIGEELDDLNYLGPLRSFPPRHLAFAENEDKNWYAGGGYAWDVVRRDDAVRQAVNNWLGADKLKTRYRLVVRSFKALDDLEDSIASALEGFEDWKESSNSEGESLQSDVDVLTSELEELEEELKSARTVRDALRTMLDRETDEQKREGLTSAYSQARSELKRLEDKKESMESELNEKQSAYEDGLTKDAGEARAEELINELNSADSETLRELALIDQRTGATVSHRDVGIGISQVLPVLVMAYGSHGKILAMEQPEIHLHPALQAELGDVFIESALGARKNTFILETHSEHLILRLLRRIRETANGELGSGACAIRPQDVAVLYVVPDKEGSVVTEIPIRQDGEFITDWPDGFFPERAEELF